MFVGGERGFSAARQEAGIEQQFVAAPSLMFSEVAPYRIYANLPATNHS